jgi:signal transduction histidine kinase
MIHLIEEVIDALTAQIEQKKHHFTLNLPDAAYVNGNFARLKQVLLNLVSNAIKYTPEQGQITITVTTAEPASLQENNQTAVDIPTMADNESLIVVRVQDTGFGIPAADLPHVFDRFFRVRNEKTEKIGGTGLGLAIAKSIIEAHDGRIWVESEEGQGSTFAFYLPKIINAETQRGRDAKK